ncbi:AraC family transcriptional regulator [Pedobacter sp. L105]|uniref:AraC family transcriptional regulator n=1 Tax=Pedobacter sp. L105 TaxID=1641871 RepID=UPI00131C0FB5|nr:AraC family transcriptional regulator [Pedobacter sp. L105]
MNYKKDGFDGQRAIVIPKLIIHKFCLFNTIINKAYITDIGYYPNAKFHYRKRPLGTDQNILIYCVEGKGKVTIDKTNYTVVPGDFFVIPCNVSHYYKSDEKDPWTIYWCHFKGEQADAIVQYIVTKESSFKNKIEFLEERIAFFDQLYANLEKGYSLDNLTYVNILFLQFLATFLFNDKFSINLVEKTDNFLENSIVYMQENINRNLTLSDLATNVNYSASHYSARFRHRTGFSPIEYFNQLKIQKACQYLQFTDFRVKEIASKIGISDPYYFTRLFGKTMGFSPKEYRESRKAVK